MIQIPEIFLTGKDFKISFHLFQINPQIRLRVDLKLLPSVCDQKILPKGFSDMIKGISVVSVGLFFVIFVSPKDVFQNLLIFIPFGDQIIKHALSSSIRKQISFLIYINSGGS